ncbi:MAG TPA: hypothetical protein VHW66_17250 [Stellaceae bacterium]|nr:hypothetical protein [Stellaceae bacterium]
MRSLRGGLTALAVAGLAVAAFAADPVKTIDTPGTGRLIMCRDWLVYTSCWSYRHVAIPVHIKIGDSLDVTFGSNNKTISFPVERILHVGDRCDVYNTPDGAVRKVNRIKIEGCTAAAE